MRTLNETEVVHVSGGSIGDNDVPPRKKIEGMAAISTAAAIGAGFYGGGWMTMAAGAAFAASPLVVGAMAGLVAYGAYRYFSSRKG